MKKRITALMCLMSLVLSGCGGDFPDMSESEAEAIGEYAAMTLLKYDANSRSRLVDLSEVEESAQTSIEQSAPEESIPEESIPQESQPKEEEATSEEVPTVDVSDAGSACDSMEEFFELPEGIEVAYADYEVCESYQESGNSYFVLEASSGKKLLVLQFYISNNGAGDQQVDFLSREDNYRVTVNGSFTRTALMTMLSNDMTTYVGSVKNGEQVETVLVIEVDSLEAENIDSITLNLKNESKTYTISLL